MSSEYLNDESRFPARDGSQRFEDRRASSSVPSTQGAEDTTCHEATVVVRGEVAPNSGTSGKSTNDRASSDKGAQTGDASSNTQAKKSPPKEMSPAKVRMRSCLPALDDDSDVGVHKEQVVTRDGKPDLSFPGTLLASAAPESATKGHWQEYRIYETDAGKHVFSKVSRTVYAEEHDTYEAEIYDPTPDSMPTQLMRSVRDLAHSRPMQWTDAATAFFGYDPLAKALYRKLDTRFEEHIS